MGIKALIGRECVCPEPECNSKFFVLFDMPLMSGKNVFCEECWNILWVPKNPGEKITIFKKSRKERRKYYKTTEAVL